MHEDEGRIRNLNEKLDSRTRYHDPADRRAAISGEEHGAVEEKWQAPELDEMLRYERRKPEGHSLTKRFFIFALVFFLCAVGAAAYIYLGGGNFISSKNVDISVNGPVTLSAGEILSLGIVITNKNNADLETANLSIRYPEGTRSALDSTKALSFERAALGVIDSGEQFSTSTSAIIYGSKGETKDIVISLEYTVKGSNATFSKEKVYQVSLGTTPVSMTVTEPETVTSNEVFTTTVTIVSNSTEVLKNVLVKGEYPYGFSVTDTTPSAKNQAKNLWDLGDMAPGDKKSITIRGKLSGQDGEERTFRFSSGVGEGGNTDRFNTLATVSESVSINRPNVTLNLSLNGEDSGAYTAPAGRVILATVGYQNNMPDNLQHAKVVVKLSGASLDRFSVVPQNGGFYDSANNQIVWSEGSSPELVTVGPGGSGTFSFQFASLATLPANAANLSIDLTATVTGSPEGASSIAVSESRKVLIGSQVTLTAQSLRSKGPFTNSGSIPPKAEKTTTYTLAFTLKDTQNDILEPKIAATLGSNVKWLSQVNPADSVTYNDASKSITWTGDKLLSGTGFSTPAKVIYVQVSLTPSIGQINSAPILLSGITFSGKDAFTGEPVTLSVPAVTTRFDTDPKFVQGDEVVVK
ncbi:DUF11 domain-containing protein [Candidatus Parcubacteria bacterium]|nr:DUF11 domain-containing protein [Candidatus Parcubacteria bacterium]